MRRALEAIALTSVGVVLGLGSLVAVAWAIRAPHEEAFGPWQGTSIVGRVPEGPYQRIAVATRGLVGLPRSETVYLDARVDGDGRAFEPGCRYRIYGPGVARALVEPHALRRRLGADPEPRRRLLGGLAQRDARRARRLTGQPTPEGVRVIRVPMARGAAFFRTLVTDPAREAPLDALRREGRCGPVS